MLTIIMVNEPGPRVRPENHLPTGQALIAGQLEIRNDSALQKYPSLHPLFQPAVPPLAQHALPTDSIHSLRGRQAARSPCCQSPTPIRIFIRACNVSISFSFRPVSLRCVAGRFYDKIIQKLHGCSRCVRACVRACVRV
jgi:hypothetical protein